MSFIISDLVVFVWMLKLDFGWRNDCFW